MMTVKTRRQARVHPRVITQLRIKKRVSKTELARKAGITAKQLTRIEKRPERTVAVTESTLMGLARAFEVEPQVLFSDDPRHADLRARLASQLRRGRRLVRDLDEQVRRRRIKLDQVTATVRAAVQRDRATLGRLQAEIDDLRRKRDEEAARRATPGPSELTDATSRDAAKSRVGADAAQSTLTTVRGLFRRCTSAHVGVACASAFAVAAMAAVLLLSADITLLTPPTLAESGSVGNDDNDSGSTPAPRDGVAEAASPDEKFAEAWHAHFYEGTPVIPRPDGVSAEEWAQLGQDWMLPAVQTAKAETGWSMEPLAGAILDPDIASVLEMFPRDRGNSMEFIKLGEVSPPSVKFTVFELTAKEWATLQEAVSCELPVDDITFQMIYEGRVDLHEGCHVDPQIVENMLSS